MNSLRLNARNTINKRIPPACPENFGKRAAHVLRTDNTKKRMQSTCFVDCSALLLRARPMRPCPDGSGIKSLPVVETYSPFHIYPVFSGEGGQGDLKSLPPLSRGTPFTKGRLLSLSDILIVLPFSSNLELVPTLNRPASQAPFPKLFYNNLRNLRNLWTTSDPRNLAARNMWTTSDPRLRQKA